jgi:hypothetical protein
MEMPTWTYGNHPEAMPDERNLIKLYTPQPQDDTPHLSFAILLEPSRQSTLHTESKPHLLNTPPIPSYQMADRLLEMDQQTIAKYRHHQGLVERLLRFLQTELNSHTLE